MNLVRVSIVMAVTLAFASCFAFAAGGTIEGKISDQSGNPVAFAIVVVEGTTLGASADANGQYKVLQVSAGPHRISASAVGYRKVSADVTVTEGQPVTQDFTLQEDVLGMKEVVVTGSFTPREKLSSTVAISTLDPGQILESQPRSTTEALRYVPGFTRIESSGGEVNENISVRGILGVEYVMFMEDGLPVFPTMHTFFMNADNLFRIDENIASMEVIRGGSSALFGSNTPGAIVNLINKTGGGSLRGTMMATGATKGLGRYDLNLNGPLSDQWRFNVGGFYRYDRGVRYPGFPGTQGGQVKASITRLLDSGFVRISAKIINDQNQFILDLPFQNPTDPVNVPGFSDYGSMNTLEGNNLRVPTPDGSLTLPLDHGLKTNAQWLTADLSFNFADRWNLENAAQIMSNAQEWNAIVPSNVVTGASFLSSFKAPAGITGLKMIYTNHFDATGAPLPVDPSMLIAPSGEWHVEKPLTAFQDQLTIKKSIGDNNFTLGVYAANYSQTNRWYFTDITMDVRDNPWFIDVVGTNGGGATVPLTKNGFRRYVSLYTNGEGTTSIFSSVLGAELNPMPLLKIDAGFRYELNDYVQVAENSSLRDLDGNAATPYDTVSWGNGSFNHFARTIDDWAGSLGANYQLTDETSVYVQGSRAYKMPALDEFLQAAAQSQVDLFEAHRTYFVEGGVKHSSQYVGLSVNGFWGELKNIVGQGAEIDTLTGIIHWVVKPSPDNRVYGAEVEVSGAPMPGLTLIGAGTFLHPETIEGTGSALTAGGIPKSVFNVSGTYSILNTGLSVAADLHYVGARDLINADYNSVTGAYKVFQKVGELAAYTYLNLGATYTLKGQGLTFLANALNVTQSQGLEEGNPRLPSSGGNFLFLARPILPFRFQLAVRYDF